MIRGHPVFAWYGETLSVLVVHEQIFRFRDIGLPCGPNLILDDGGDATLLVHKGEFEKEGRVPAFNAKSDSENGARSPCARKSLADLLGYWGA